VNYGQGILLGLVQGLTEFLPVSSSGHLVVAQAAIGLSIPGVFVEVVLHVATLLAVFVVYARRITSVAAGCLAGRREAWTLVGLLAVGSVPAGVVGLLFKETIEQVFDSLALVGIDFLVTGAILWSTRSIAQRARHEVPTAGGALLVGMAQALAILPGVSRSGTTVSAALWLGVRPEQAAEFSFLLAVPAIAGAAALQIPEISGASLTVGWGPLAVSFLASLAAGVVAIRFLVALLRSGRFYRFAPYCWAIGIVTLGWALLR
jgi:undecaprenyl-diphosphatase